MWLLFGIAAMITALLNVGFTVMGKDSKWYMFFSLSFAALTMCASYSQEAQWVLSEDWSALMDVVPTMSNYYWFLILASIAVNSISLFEREK